MAGLGGFLQGLGLAYGNTLIAGQNFEEQQARTSLLKSEAAMQGLQAQQMQQKVKTEKQLGDFISSQMQLEGADAALPQNQAKMFTKAAGLAAASGDFASMSEMNSLAHSSQQQAREEATYAAQQQARAKDSLGSAAQDYAQNPTQEGFKDLVQKAVAAGVNPASIPVNPNSPEGKAWINNQVLAGMDSKDRANFVQKAADMKAKREQEWRIHEDSDARIRATNAQTALYREALIGLRRDEAAGKAPSHIDINGSTYQWDPNGSVKGDRLASDGRYVKLGDKITGQAAAQNNLRVQAAAQAVQDLDQLGRFGAGTTSSPFSHMTDSSFVSSLEKTGANALTPEQIQMFQTSTAGLSRMIDRVETLGGGRSSTAGQLAELKTQITPAAGDTQLEAAYKLAKGAQIVKTALEASPVPQDASVAKSRQATLDRLSKYPTPEQILDAAQGPERAKLAKQQSSYAKLLSDMGVGEPGLPGGSDPGAGSKAPPLPSDISTLVNKYGSQ